MKKLLFFAALALAACQKGGDGTPADRIDVADVELNMHAYRLPVGDARLFFATVSPDEATDKEVVWKSDDEAVATVENGVVTALKEGEAKISVTTRDGGKSDLCTVTVIEAAVACELSTPGWGESLGEVGFRSGKTWTVGSQTWSDVVVASRCDKETFDSGANPAYKADCRNNDRFGHLFSWAAVYRFQSELCPDGWRVPAKEDYIALDVAFGGDGEFRIGQQEFMAETYFDPEVWGAEYAGYCGSNGARVNQEGETDGVFMGYYTSSQDGMYGYSIDHLFQPRPDHPLGDICTITPASQGMKYIGFPLRCVK